MTLEALAELNIDDVRRDVERLERALRIARAVLRELTAPEDRPALDLTDDDVDSVAHRLEDRHGVTVRPACDCGAVEGRFHTAHPSGHAVTCATRRDDVRPGGETAPPRAESPPPAPPASRQAPAAASTPTLSLARRVGDYLVLRPPGEWVAVSTAAAVLDANPTSVANACRDLVRAGDLEHNGRRSKASRYRWRHTSAPPDHTDGTLEGRAVDALAYQPGTFDDLAARLGVRDTNGRADLLRAMIRLERDDSITRNDQRPAVYRVTAA